MPPALSTEIMPGIFLLTGLTTGFEPKDLNLSVANANDSTGYIAAELLRYSRDVPGHGRWVGIWLTVFLDKHVLLLQQVGAAFGAVIPQDQVVASAMADLDTLIRDERIHYLMHGQWAILCPTDKLIESLAPHPH